MKLLEPFQLGPLALSNHMVMAPMTRSRAGAGEVIPPLGAEYYAQRAAAGLIISEGTQVSPQGQGYIDTPGIYSPEQAAGWRQVTDAVHAKGGKIFAQLWHVGRVSHTSFQPGGAAPVAPSALAAEGQAYTRDGFKPMSLPRALETQEIAEVIGQFVRGATQAQAAGFDGVELHGANGYLIDQFLREGSNRRTDAYGGSHENRARFLLDLVDAIVPVWGADRVGVRLSPALNANGATDPNPLPTFRYAVEQLSKRRVVYLHLLDPLQMPQRFAPILRPLFTGTLMVNGGFDRDKAEAALQAHDADLVSFGTAFLANPDLPERFRRGAALNPADKATFYGGGAHGYTDYPTLTP